MVDQTGTLTPYMYDAYGEACRPDSGGNPITSTPFGYKAQRGAYTDQETGLVLMGFRPYDPSTGRFLTRGPIGVAGGINLYAFCRDDPVAFACFSFWRGEQNPAFQL